MFFALFLFLFLGDRETWEPILWEVLVGHFQQDAEAWMTVNIHLISYWKHTPITIISEHIWIAMIKPTNDKHVRSLVRIQRLLWGERPICLSLETQDQCLLSAARSLNKRKNNGVILSLDLRMGVQIPWTSNACLQVFRIHWKDVGWMKQVRAPR